MLDNLAKEWLENHNEELKVSLWPSPIKILNLDIFENINSIKTFNSVIGNPDNWDKINEEIYEKWIVPNAIILFGKKWFNKVKYRNSIQNGVPFSLFTKEEKEIYEKIEDSDLGKSVILKIIEKVKYSLNTYLKGKWIGRSNLNPGNYIISSLRNEFIKEIGNNLGYKLKLFPICPYCLTNSQKVVLTIHGSNQYSCPKCENLIKTLENSKEKSLLEKLDNVKKFKRFVGITCVCPNNNCPGKFIPLNCVDFSRIYLEDLKQQLHNIGKELLPIKLKSIKYFKYPPNSILNLPIKCPFCSYKFIIKNALQNKSGYKNKSGFLTGLPSANIWTNKLTSLDSSLDKSFTIKNNIDDIEIRERADILRKELTYLSSGLNAKTFGKLLTQTFFSACVKWIDNNTNDAVKYLFENITTERNLTEKEKILYPNKDKINKTKTPHNDISVHYSIFNIWMNIVENNLDKFNKININIKSLKDFNWFCHPPKFNGGPKSSFKSKINSKMKVNNNSKIKDKQHKARIGKILGIYKNGEKFNYINEIKSAEFNSIQFKENLLKPNDIVRIEALFLDGHPTCSVIQRIIRLRKKYLKNIIEQIKKEEETGIRNVVFWNKWIKKIKEKNNGRN